MDHVGSGISLKHLLESTEATDDVKRRYRPRVRASSVARVVRAARRRARLPTACGQQAPRQSTAEVGRPFNASASKVTRNPYFVLHFRYYKCPLGCVCA